MKKVLVISGCLLWVILVIGIIIFTTLMFKAEHKEEPVHLHAAFIVVKDDGVLDFSPLRYMKIAACTNEHGAELSPEEEQLEKAHMHDKVGNVVHIHRADATWGDLFTNIDFELHDPVGYINGERVVDILSHEIKAYDRIVIFENSMQNIEEYMNSVPTIERIKEVESMGESCSI